MLIEANKNLPWVSMDRDGKVFRYEKAPRLKPELHKWMPKTMAVIYLGVPMSIDPGCNVVFNWRHCVWYEPEACEITVFPEGMAQIRRGVRC